TSNGQFQSFQCAEVRRAGYEERVSQPRAAHLSGRYRGRTTPMHVARLQILLITVVLGVFFAGPAVSAQILGSSVSGIVTDPSSAIISQADITLSGDNNPTQVTKTDLKGFYKFDGVSPGIYTVTASADGFAIFRKDGIAVTSGHPVVVNIALKIDVQEQ